MNDKDKLADAATAYHERMHKIARVLDVILNADIDTDDDDERTVGFVLMVFPFNEGRCDFLSNVKSSANRRDIVALMKQMIAQFEGQPRVAGRA